MNDQSTKKAKVERLIILALAGCFLFTFSGAVKSVRWLFHAQAPKKPAAVLTSVNVPKSLAETFKEHWETIEPGMKGQLQPNGSSKGAAKAGGYTAHQLRDPLVSLLPDAQPKKRPPTDATPPVKKVEEPPPPALPELTVQGLWWDSPNPVAIIDGHLYGIGDTVQGGTILSIGRHGVTINFDGRIRQLTTVAGRTANPNRPVSKMPRYAP